jgi:hypothetical protein
VCQLFPPPEKKCTFTIQGSFVGPLRMFSNVWHAWHVCKCAPCVPSFFPSGNKAKSPPPFSLNQKSALLLYKGSVVGTFENVRLFFEVPEHREFLLGRRHETRDQLFKHFLYRLSTLRHSNLQLEVGVVCLCSLVSLLLLIIVSLVSCLTWKSAWHL